MMNVIIMNVIIIIIMNVSSVVVFVKNYFFVANIDTSFQPS